MKVRLKTMEEMEHLLLHENLRNGWISFWTEDKSRTQSYKIGHLGKIFEISQYSFSTCYKVIGEDNLYSIEYCHCEEINENNTLPEELFNINIIK